MQLKHKFFLILALLTSIPLLILLFGVVDRLETEVQLRTEKELHVTLDKMADEISILIENQMAIAKGLAHVPAVQQFSTIISKAVGSNELSAEDYQRRADELEQFFLNYQHAVPTIQALRFIDLQGKTLVKVKEGKPIEPKLLDEKYGRLYVADQSSKSFFRYTINSHEDVVMSDFELGKVTYEADFCPAMVRYSARIKDELGSVDGLLVINMWGTRFDSAVEASLGGYPGNAFIVEMNEGSTRDGIYLYHKDSSKRFGNQLNSQYRFTQQLTTQQWQQIKSTELRGSMYMQDGRMFFYRKLVPFTSRSDTTWLLLIGADKNTVLAPIENLRQSIWFLLVVLLLVSLLVSVWAAWKLSKPVHELAEVITEFADGDTNVRYNDMRSDEIGLAGKAFNYLAQSVEKAQHERDKAERQARQSDRLASVGQLAAGIGHEINNPLMNIMSLASLIEEAVKNKDPEILNDVSVLKKEGQRCARIVQGILSFARENKPHYHEFNLAQLIDETLDLLQHRLETADINVVTELQEHLYMNGDANQIQQVLVNVILNAVQASPEGGTININAREELDYVSIEIIDTGTGISNENLSRVFDPFFTTKNEGEGTGLGLSVSYGIVKHHGGTIHLQNVDDSGLRVAILLPLHARIEDQEEYTPMEAQHVI